MATERAEELPPIEPRRAEAPPLELTPRALIVGSAIGVLLSAGNGYMGLKTSFIDGGSVMAALLGFAFFATFGRSSKRPYSSLENNVTQTVASSAAIMGYAIGLPGAIPALDLMGTHYPGWGLVIWGIALGFVGILLGAMLRRKLILAERLPFPTGAATAEVIETISASRETAITRTRVLVGAALVAAAIAWFRDGHPTIIPQATMFGGSLFGVSLASLAVGVSFSPAMSSVGMLIGVRSAASMLLGGSLSWLVAAPLLVRSGLVPTASFSACAGWLIWPALGLLLASSFVPLVFSWRSFVRSFRDIPSLFRRRAEPVDAAELVRSRFRLAKPMLLVSVVVLVILGRIVFALPPVVILIGLLLAVALANVCARSAGETDMAPTGQVGTMTQLMFMGSGPVASLMAGSITAGVASQTSQMLWAFKAGHRLHASARAQIWAQMLGAVVGALVAVPVYLVMTHTYGIGTETMPAPSAMSWKATAEAVRGGMAAMPPHAPLAGALAFVVGAILSSLAVTRLGRFLPSPAAMGMAVITPFSLSCTATLGAFVLFLFQRFRPSTSDATLMAVAAGGIAGESLMGILVAALIASGLL